MILAWLCRFNYLSYGSTIIINFNSFSAGTVLDVRVWRLKTVPALEGLKAMSAHIYKVVNTTSFTANHAKNRFNLFH